MSTAISTAFGKREHIYNCTSVIKISDPFQKSHPPAKNAAGGFLQYIFS